jgi:hypothetical protein
VDALSKFAAPSFLKKKKRRVMGGNFDADIKFGWM